MKRFVNGATASRSSRSGARKRAGVAADGDGDFPSGRSATSSCANDAAHLVWAVNLGVIDFNPWPVRRADLDHPDELRVDLDPTPEVALGRGAPGRAGACATCSPSTAWSASRRRPARAASTSTCGSSRAGSSPRCAAPRWRWPARSSGACRSSRPASGGRRSATACSSTTTRTRATARSRRPTRCAPMPDARVSCAARRGTRCRRRAGRPARSTPCPQRLRERGDPAAGIDDARRLARRAARARRARRGGGPRRRAVAAALPEAAGRAQARAAEPRAQGRLTHAARL